MSELSSFIKQVVIVDDDGTPIMSPVIMDNDFTGIINIPSAGTPVSGGNISSPGGFFLKAHPDNSDTVWFFPAGRTKANGFPLNIGEAMLCNITNLNLLAFDADVSANKICWAKA